MKTETRLKHLDDVGHGVLKPGYLPQDHGSGIVHLGPGAFHRAHQAVYTDDALAESGGDWRIIGISLQSQRASDQLNPQGGLYTLLERGKEGDSYRLIGSIERVISAASDRQTAMAALVDPATRIVSLTVTEKAYGLDREHGGIDLQSAVIEQDLSNPTEAKGAVGMLVESLRQRRLQGTTPFTVLCCDNLPNNGKLIAGGVVDFARRVDPDLAGWIEQNVEFPSTMVDRITPATSQSTLQLCKAATGRSDLACVETEQFTQWVIEDKFCNGRPDWEAGGALFVPDVAPYEHMKLRMLNGAHSMLAYAGYLNGRKFVRDVMEDPNLAPLVSRHMSAAAQTLAPLQGVNYAQYASQLVERFKNPALAHETYQIAMDGTQKLAQRLLEPACDALERGNALRPFAFAVASWMRYCVGRNDAGATYQLRDPREAEIKAALTGQTNAHAMSNALHRVSGLFPPQLIDNPQWRASVEEILERYLDAGCEATIAHEASLAQTT